MRYFYCDDVIRTLVHESGNSSLYYNNRQPLAILSDRHDLLCVSEDHSVISSLTDGCFRWIVYAPYGAIAGNAQTSLAFKGAYLEPVTGTYPLGNGYRFYHPKLMRFSTADSESPFKAGGINTYAFAACDPINNSDPTGRNPWTKRFSMLGKNYNGTGIKVDGVRVFYSEPSANSDRKILNIQTHGAPGIILGKERGYTPVRLEKLLKENGYDIGGVETHILACYSAAPLSSGEPSFIAQLAKLTGAPVHGYINGVPTMRSSDGNHHHAVVLPVLPGFKQLMNQSADRVTVSPEQTQHSVRRGTIQIK